MSSMTDTKRIERLERLHNSVNGNPTYRVHFTDGSSAVTAADRAWLYEITNADHRGDLLVDYTDDGKIDMLRPA